MISTISVRPFHPSDLGAVLELLRVSLGETEVNRRSPELFSWKHLDNPFGKSIMLVAEDRAGIVGFRAFMRWELATVEGERIRCVRPVDTATHPRAQRRGIFRKLTLEAVEAARDDGVDLIFNTPNPRSGAGYLTMGWKKVGRIGVLARPLLRGFVRQSQGLPVVLGSGVWDDRPVNHRSPNGLRTPRTLPYLRWRFALHPMANYRVIHSSEGTAVLRPNLRHTRPELAVSDLFGDGAGHALRVSARATDALYLAGWFSPGSRERHQARSAGMLPVPGVTALTLMARPLSDGIALAIDGLHNWDLALSDLELL